MNETAYWKLGLVAIQVVVYVLYYLYTHRFYGIQESISDVFLVSQKKFGKGSPLPWILFYGFMLGIGIPLHLIILSGWSFFAMCGLIFTSTAAQIRQKGLTERVHIVAAVSGILLAFVALGFRMWMISTIFFVVYLVILWLLRKIANYIWWIESIALFMVMILEVVYILM